ncbi:MAG: hypothetical protein ABIJ18_04360 [archaeon]
MALNTYGPEDIKEGFLYLVTEGNIIPKLNVYRIGNVQKDGFLLLRAGEMTCRERFESLSGVLLKPSEDGTYEPLFPRRVLEEITSFSEE